MSFHFFLLKLIIPFHLILLAWHFQILTVHSAVFKSHSYPGYLNKQGLPSKKTPVFCILAGPSGTGKTTTQQYVQRLIELTSTSRPVSVVSVDDVVSKCPEYREEMREWAEKLEIVDLGKIPTSEEQLEIMESLAEHSVNVYFKYRNSTNADDRTEDILDKSFREQHHIFFESTLGHSNAYNFIKENLIPKAKRYGYRVVVVKPEVSPDILVQRCWLRAQKGMRDEGRLVKPSDIVRFHNYFQTEQPVEKLQSQGSVSQILTYDGHGKRPLLTGMWTKESKLRKSHLDLGI